MQALLRQSVFAQLEMYVIFCSKTLLQYCANEDANYNFLNKI